jgi:hypothetical protein
MFKKMRATYSIRILELYMKRMDVEREKPASDSSLS